MNWLSLLKTGITAFRLSKKTKPVDAPLWIGYSSCDTLPLRVFVDCLVDGKFELLTLSGTGSPDQLKMLWLKLLSEFYIKSGNEQMLSIVTQMGQAHALQAKIMQCKRLVLELYKGHNETFENCLKDWGYKLRYYSEYAYEKELERVKKLLKGEEERLQKMAEVFAPVEKRDKSKIREDMIQHFTMQMAALTKFMGVPIRLHDEKLTVTEYCGYLKLMNDYNEATNKQLAHAG